MEWLLLTVLGFVAFSDTSSSSSSSSPAPSGDGSKLVDFAADDSADTIRMTCAEALSVLPMDSQAQVGAAIDGGTDPGALRTFADVLRGRAVDPTVSDTMHAAFLILAHCLDARADELAPMKPIFPVDDYSDIPLSATALRGGMLKAGART